MCLERGQRPSCPRSNHHRTMNLAALGGTKALPTLPEQTSTASHAIASTHDPAHHERTRHKLGSGNTYASKHGRRPSLTYNDTRNVSTPPPSVAVPNYGNLRRAPHTAQAPPWPTTVGKLQSNQAHHQWPPATATALHPHQGGQLSRPRSPHSTGAAAAAPSCSPAAQSRQPYPPTSHPGAVYTLSAASRAVHVPPSYGCCGGPVDALAAAGSAPLAGGLPVNGDRRGLVCDGGQDRMRLR